ncbi:unnamed protein product [Clonostachys rosea f. rosea IK726]|uniref:feruloyl esterase n=2 Tax=Bionectria ochroleuca TaxID=29856 RepID=A0A0B7K5E1_BIOOC|nr:unnamed protein product [Clonostachys rosea f. rosea IK726]
MFFSTAISVLLCAASVFSGSEAAAVHKRASSGCGKSHNFIGETKQFSFESSGGTRTYRIFLPKGYKVNSPQPLIIAYHGSGKTPEDMEDLTKFSDESINSKMVVVFPAGVEKHWQGPSYAKEGVSDKVFTTDLVNRIKDNYCIDESRVYAAGQSNGGGFVNTLACSPDHGGQFAAFAASSAALYTDVKGDETCHPARSPLPFLESHGTNDQRIHYDGDNNATGGPVPAIPEWLGRWARRNKCSGSSSSDIGNDVEQEKWTCAGEKGLLTHFKLNGHGHAYPSSSDEQLFLSPKIIDFFNSHTKP